MSNIFFTADEHYGHNNIISFCKRPFSDASEMREKLIENHNDVVKSGDLVYHLGDMFWRTLSADEAISIRARLNGQHFYIKGNHEEVMEKSKELRNLFIWVRDIHNLKFGAGIPNIVLCHYAMRTWNGSHRGSYQLYGHTHNELPEDGWLSMDVGVDARNFSPVSLEQIRSTLSERAKLAVSRYWSCDDAQCNNKFNAVDTNPKICSKCGSTMKLMSTIRK